MGSNIPYSSPSQPRVPVAGVWSPAVTFFNHATDQLDLSSQAKYFAYLAGSGLAGIVVLGTNSEAFLLTREERFLIITTARKSISPGFPLMVGVGAHSTKQSLQLAEDAAKAGADYLLVLPPAYFGKATNMKVVRRFFVDFAEKAPLPVVIYNSPTVCNGVDIDAETILSIYRESAASHTSGRSNVVGVNLACGSVGKITRLAITLQPEQFSAFGGQSDFLIGGLAAGSAGCIADFAAVFPSLTARIYGLYREGRLEDAMRLQMTATLAEGPCKNGIAHVKYAVACYSAKSAGIENAEEKLAPRHPYDPVGAAAKRIARELMRGAAKVDHGLQLH